MFGEWLLNNPRPDDVDILKVDLPLDVTFETPWRVTRLSRRRVYWPTRPERTALEDVGRMGYGPNTEPGKPEPDSDIYALDIDHCVAVTPMSLDMTSRTDLGRLQALIVPINMQPEEKPDTKV